MLQLSKYSIGVGDRFAHQAKAQLPTIWTIEWAQHRYTYPQTGSN